MHTPAEIAEDILDRACIAEAAHIVHVDQMKTLIADAIEADRAQRSPYLLSFEPDAIRDHFEADEDDPTEGMTDEQLEGIALDALQDDRLYAVFHELLSEGVGA